MIESFLSLAPHHQICALVLGILAVWSAGHVFSASNF